MPNGFREVKSSRCEAAVLPGSYSLRHRRQKGEKVQLPPRPFAVTSSPHETLRVPEAEIRCLKAFGSAVS
jgi:hypothetical protein